MKVLSLGDEGEKLFIDDAGHLWLRDCVGDEICVACTKTDLEAFIVCLRQMAEELPE